MSTANLVPETWRLTGDDAKKTLARTGRTRLIKDAFTRLRFSDGFSHARSKDRDDAWIPLPPTKRCVP